MPDITIIVGVFHTVENLLHGIELIRAKHHQAFVALMQYYVLAYNLAQRALVEEHCGKFLQVIERHIGCIRPVECELISAIRIICKIASVYTIGYDKQLDVVKQSMERSLVVALYLVVCLFQFHTSALQLYLNQWQSVDKYRHIVTAFLSALNRNLIGNLKLVLTPVSAVQELHPQAFTAFQFKRKEVSQFLCLFKASATFKIDKYLFKLRLCKFGTPQFFQLLLVVFLQLFLEIGRQVLLLFNMNILVVHLLKSIYKSVFEGSFTLYWHILLLFVIYTIENFTIYLFP